MNEALARRVFLVAMVVCVGVLGLADGTKYVGNMSSDGMTSVGRQQIPATAQPTSVASAAQQLAAVDNDIASANADLARISGDTGVLQDK
jgi:hypothetical protein